MHVYTDTCSKITYLTPQLWQCNSFHVVCSVTWLIPAQHLTYGSSQLFKHGSLETKFILPFLSAVSLEALLSQRLWPCFFSTEGEEHNLFSCTVGDTAKTVVLSFAVVHVSFHNWYIFSRLLALFNDFRTFCSFYMITLDSAPAFLQVYSSLVPSLI